MALPNKREETKYHTIDRTEVQAKSVQVSECNLYFFQTLTNVLQEHQVVMLMRTVSTPRDRTVALAKLVIMETERIVKVART